jgi:hypothetical protein
MLLASLHAQLLHPVGLSDLERFRRRAEQRRAEAEMTVQSQLREELLQTAVAYERMALRAERLLGPMQ